VRTSPVDSEEKMKLGESYGFEVVRFCGIEPFYKYRAELNKRIETGLYSKAVIESVDLLHESKIDPRSIDKEAKTIIALAIYYYTPDTVDKTKPGEPNGVLARNYMKDVYSARRLSA